MSNTLKKITTRAKQIYAKGGTWRGAIKKAGAEYRGAKHKTKKRSHGSKRRKTSHRKKVGVVWPAAVAGSSMNGTISGHTSAIKKLILEQIGDLEKRKFSHRLKRDKKVFAKQIAELKRKYRKLS